MAKAVAGAALLAGAVALDVATGGLATTLTPLEVSMLTAVGSMGASMLAGSIADALTSNRGMGITTRQPAAYQQVIYGERRVGGVSVYESTTGSQRDQYNYVIAIAGHETESIVNLYLDGRQVHWLGSGPGYSVRNGVGFGGIADGNDYVGPDGNLYNFGGTGHSGIYCEARYGDQATTDVIGALTANDPNWAADGAGNYPSLAGCTYVYLKIEFNQALFPNPPEIKFTVRGKNNILDPRIGTRGYSINPALIAADILTDTEFGLGDVDAFQDSGSLAQLIAAANICDEQVQVQALSRLGPVYESRYTAHHVYDAGTTPGAALGPILDAMGGRITTPGGEYYIFPAAWTGASFAFSQGDLAGGIRWEPKRAQRDLCNRVMGTYTAPTVPWNIAGDLYDRNGWYNGTLQDNFPFAFQPTSYPAYAADALHGYAADAYLESDSGLSGVWAAGATYNLGDVVSVGSGTSLVMYKSLVAGNVGNAPASSPTKWAPYENLLPLHLDLPAVLSSTQAQRLAKIKLLRNRFQGSGDLPMHQWAFAMQGCDVMEFTFPAMGWTSKTLEIEGVTTAVTEGDEENAPADTLSVHAIETGPSVYAWNPGTEELTVYDIAAGPSQQNRMPAAPTGMSLTSGASTALVALDGVVTPRVEVQWTPPADVLASQIQIQFQAQPSGGPAGPWINAGFADVSQTSFFAASVLSGATYGFRIRSVRGNSNATSAWVEIDGFTVGAAISQLTQLGVGIGTLTSAVTGSTAAILGTPFSFKLGGNTISVAPSNYPLSGLNQAQLYFVYYVDTALAGGAVAAIATRNPADFLGKYGYFLIDSIVTASTGGAPPASGMWYPSAFLDLQDGATQGTVNPAAPYSQDPTQFALLTGSYYSLGSGATETQFDEIVYEGWPSITPSPTIIIGGSIPVTLYVFSRFSAAAGAGGTLTVSVSWDGGTTWTTISTQTGSSSSSFSTVTYAVPSGTNLSNVRVKINVSPATSGSSTPPALIDQLQIGVTNVLVANLDF